METSSRHQILVVGGGAGGLELVSKLGRTLGKRGKADITLIDSKRTHIWKPLLHEVASGTIDQAEYELEYLAQAHDCHFRFRLGHMESIDRAKQEVIVSPTYNDAGEEIIPRRHFHYDTLVIAVGSKSNDFGIPGVKENCLFLDTLAQAEKFQKFLLDAMLRIHTKGCISKSGKLDISIIGAGATGVELIAQLHQVTRQMTAYGLDEQFKPDEQLQLHLIEASGSILPSLPRQVVDKAEAQLRELGVDIHINERVIEVTKEEVITAAGKTIPSRITVWAAGIKAPDFLTQLDGLETNRINQLETRPTLQTTLDDNIFALGDCAANYGTRGGLPVPPRAQAAHQQASYLFKVIRRRLKNRGLGKGYSYSDYGSLITMGRYSTVGNLMGNIPGTIMVSGVVARLVYLSLYKMHEVALYGLFRTGLLLLANLLRRGIHPQIKLH